MDGRKFFRIDDRDITYLVVARDEPHVHLIVEGVDFGDGEESLSEAVADPNEGVKFRELSRDEAFTTNVRDDNGNRKPLTDFEPGALFCSEE